MLSLSHLLVELSQWPDPDSRTLARRGSQELGLRDFLSAVEQFMELAQSRPERRWGIYLEDSYHFALCFLGLLQAGKVPVVLPTAQPDFLAQLSSEIDLVLLDSHSNSLALPQLVFEEPARRELPGSFLSLDLELSKFVLFTSGSTGLPKKIEKRLSQIDCELQTLEALWGGEVAEAVFLSTVSHQHIYGLLFRVLWPLCSGKIFDTRLYNYPSDLAEAMGHCERAVLISSPSHLNRLPELMDLGAQKSRIAALFSSGGPLSHHAAIALGQALGRAPWEVFGSTETGGVAYRCQDERVDSKLWKAFSGLKFRIESSGKLALRSPYLEEDSWYEMEDLARGADDDLFELLGRADSVVKVEGKRVSLKEIETRLAMSGWVADVRALLITESRAYIAVVLALSPEGMTFVHEQSEAALKTALKQELSAYFERVLLPRKWRIVLQMPVNHQGKTTRKDLEALFLDENIVKPIVLSVVESQNRVEMDLRVPESIRYFRGHFRDHPILPGVAQVDWAAEYAKLYFQPSAPFRRLEVVKFHEFILPQAKVKLTLSYRPEQQKVTFTFSGEDCKHSSGRIIFE